MCRRYTDVVLAADQEVDGLCLRRIPDEARHRRSDLLWVITPIRTPSLDSAESSTHRVINCTGVKEP
jgi:hypothetical protein